MKQLILILFFFQACRSSATDNRVFSPGVITVNDSFKNLSILNEDGTLYLKIIRDKNGEIKSVYSNDKENGSILKSIKHHYPFYYAKHKKYGVPLPNISIRAFYPDYDIIVLDAFKYKSGYKVFVNGFWKYVKLSPNVSYKTWVNHLIKDIYVVADIKNPVYEKNNLKSRIITSENIYSYKVVRVEGEWIEVECLKECEGCPQNRIQRGWMKWKQGNNILIDLYYSC